LNVKCPFIGIKPPKRRRAAEYFHKKCQNYSCKVKINKSTYERNTLMKNRQRKNPPTGKALAIAAVIGAAAVGAAVISAYNSTISRLVPTSAETSSNTWVFESSTAAETETAAAFDEEAAEVALPAVIEEIAETAAETEEPAEEANKPVTADIGNILPVEGEVSHPFSSGELVKSETLGVWKTHDGCDILCELGTPVKSMSEGTVKEITEDPLWGVYVIVEQSNGLEVHYCGLAKELNVKVGQQINQGETIGTTSDTCQVEIVQKPHLHLGVKQGGKWIDPMSVIDKSDE
jgi:murein DD-endopeptidase MepM/ murein hydrolase activator NlpD